MARDTWYRLDNVGKFYSSQAGSTAQTVFRFSATLTHEIDPDILQHAVDKTVGIFPSFNVCLRSGMFWHYLEQAATPPEVHKENLPICFGLHVDARSVLIRVSYYRNRVNLEVSHIVSDGRGTTDFFKALLYAYLQERHNLQGIDIEYDGSDHQKSENSFDKYYDRALTSSALTHQQRNGVRKPKVYHLSGWRDGADPTYLEYHLPTRQVQDMARASGVSVTSLLIAALVCAIQAEMPKRYLAKEIRIGIPVDLRHIFGSATTKNFFGLTSVASAPMPELTVEEMAVRLHTQLKEATTAEHLQARMNRMIKLEKNLLLRFSPLFLKDLALEIADYFAAREVTTTVSNLGRITLDERLAAYVHDINILTSTTGLNFVLCSCGDVLSIGISTVYANMDILKHFCRHFTSRGIEGHLNLSKTSEEVAADWREARFETSVKRLSGQAPASDQDDVTEQNTASGLDTTSEQDVTPEQDVTHEQDVAFDQTPAPDEAQKQGGEHEAVS